MTLVSSLNPSPLLPHTIPYIYSILLLIVYVFLQVDGVTKTAAGAGEWPGPCARLCEYKKRLTVV